MIRQLAPPFAQTIPHEQHRAQHLLLLQFDMSGVHKLLVPCNVVNTRFLLNEGARNFFLWRTDTYHVQTNVSFEAHFSSVSQASWWGQVTDVRYSNVSVTYVPPKAIGHPAATQWTRHSTYEEDGHDDRPQDLQMWRTHTHSKAIGHRCVAEFTNYLHTAIIEQHYSLWRSSSMTGGPNQLHAQLWQERCWWILSASVLTFKVCTHLTDTQKYIFILLIPQDMHCFYHKFIAPLYTQGHWPCKSIRFDHKQNN